MTLHEQIAELRTSIQEGREDSHAIFARLCAEHGSTAVAPLLSMMEFEEHQSDYYYSVIHMVEGCFDELGLGVLLDNADKMLSSSRLLGVMLLGRFCNSPAHYNKLLRTAKKHSISQRQSLAALFELVACKFELLAKKYPMAATTAEKARSAVEKLREKH